MFLSRNKSWGAVWPWCCFSDSATSRLTLLRTTWPSPSRMHKGCPVFAHRVHVYVKKMRGRVALSASVPPTGRQGFPGSRTSFLLTSRWPGLVHSKIRVWCLSFFSSSGLCGGRQQGRWDLGLSAGRPAGSVDATGSRRLVPSLCSGARRCC